MNISILYSQTDPVLKFAANELKSYLTQMNQSLEISLQNQLSPHKIFLNTEPLGGNTSNPELDDFYSIYIESLSGFITGCNSRSVLLGVYRYLTLAGCRFLIPGKQGESIPTNTDITLFDQKLEAKADLRHRGVCIEGADSFENIINFIDWMPKLGFNSFFIQFKVPYSFMKLWYQHKNNPLLPEEMFHMEDAEEFSKQIDKEMQKRGLLHHRVGHGWTSEILGQPALGWVESDTPLSKEAKEYIALVEGEREYFHGIPINTNLCYSNPDVISSFTREVVTYAAEHSEVDYLHIWLADTYNNHCECDNCAKQLPTDQYIHILNEIDRELTKKKLPTKIVFLLYQELLWPPLKETIQNNERFVLMFAPISRTFDHSYQEHSSIAPIPEFHKNHIFLPNSLEENIAFLREWQKCFNGDSFDYDYPLGRAHYGDLSYLSISKTIYNDIQELKNLQLNGYMSCQELRCFLPNSLPNYIMGLSLFDSSLSYDEIVQDYFKHAYGSFSDDCFSYLNTLSSYYSCDYFNKIGSRENKELAGKFQSALLHIENFIPSLNKFLKKSTGIHYMFWKNLDYHSKYSILLTRALYHLASQNTEMAHKAFQEFLYYIRSTELDCQEYLDVYRIIEVATNYTGFKADA